MVDMMVRLSGAIILGALGGVYGPSFGKVVENPGYLPWGLVFTLVGIGLGLLVTPYLTYRFPIKGVKGFSEVSFTKIMAGALGLVLGLVVASLLSIPIARLEGPVGVVLPIALSIALALLGVAAMLSRERDIEALFPALRVSKEAYEGLVVLMDTSAIIDGRIADLVDTGFLHGSLEVPRFVLDELRRIADSGDSLRRNRGRRGLEVLNRLRKGSNMPLKVLDVDNTEGVEVDAMLVKLARSMKASILTTDYNLNRVAEVQGVKVLNVNELANALKPVVMPGEEISVRVIQEGKEVGQGVGFLDDGTMIVVEGGRRFLNSYLDVTVTRMLQTAAGRIIFAQPKGAA